MGLELLKLVEKSLLYLEKFVHLGLAKAENLESGQTKYFKSKEFPKFSVKFSEIGTETITNLNCTKKHPEKLYNFLYSFYIFLILLTMMENIVEKNIDFTIHVSSNIKFFVFCHSTFFQKLICFLWFVLFSQAKILVWAKIVKRDKFN